MAGAQINPLLIERLTDKEIKEIPESPTVSWLPGKYARLINRKKGNIERIFEENPFMITCTSCGRKGKYDVGLMVINTDLEKNEVASKDRIQTTGYFRCKHCNDAGNWEVPKQFAMAAMTGMLVQASTGKKDKSTYGKNLLYDGSWHLFSSDGEKHLLHKLSEDPNNSFIWNRLGNLYQKGNRPELAASVFEHSITIDPDQIESHFTLGSFLAQIDEYEKSAYHFKQMLLRASNYQSMPAEGFRQLVAAGLQELFFIKQLSNGEISFLPSREELESSGRRDVLEYNRIGKEIEIIPDDIESFYPFAELFMGPQSRNLPSSTRTLKIKKPAKKVKKRHKRNKRK